MAGGKITQKDGFFKVEGQVDESLDYKVFDGAPRPLKLELSGVRNVNSVGVREFLGFVGREAGKGLEFHRCSAAVMDMINTFPASLGSPPNPGIVRSMVVTYRCSKCVKDENLLLEVKVGLGVAPALPFRACAKCSTAMRSTVDAEDLFTYMLVDD